MKILVCCGSGVATSTMVKNKLKASLESKGKIGIKIDHCRMMDVEGMIDNYDLLVSNIQQKKDYGVPTVNGVPFLTGIGLDATTDKIISLLKL